MRKGDINKKAEIDSIIAKIIEIELDSLKQLDEASLNKGLHSAEESTKLFDEVLKLDKLLIDPHKNTRDLLEKKEMYDDRVHNLKILQHEVGILSNTLSELDREIGEDTQTLENTRSARHRQIQENLRLEKLLKELEEKEEKAARELEVLKERSTPVKDISLKTTRRLGGTQRSKSKLQPMSMTIKLSDGEIDVQQSELQPDKLSSTLVGKKHERARARSELGEGETKWKKKVNILYEGVDELYTPSTTEMEQRAEIHRLLGKYL